MKTTTLFSAVAALMSAAEAAKESRTFAVLRFNGDGPLTEGRADPIVMQNQKLASAHVHTVMGAAGFGLETTGQSLTGSRCTNAKIKGDNSAYWYPKMYFHDKSDNTFEPVNQFYTNVYYFFDKTHDQIKAFPLGLNIVAGNASTRVAPATRGDTKLTSPGAQPASWTCPRKQPLSAPSWPPNSDGTSAGFQSRNNEGEGTGFPFAKCDGYASPLRADLHFPSCYNPDAGLTSYKSNMVYPSDNDGYLDCPPGYVHVPHLFLEVYWNTPLFDSRWTVNNKDQPFVLANGDRTGFSMHGDFISGWDEATLQHIIDTCDKGTEGMDKCPGVELTPTNVNCKVENPWPEQITGKLSQLPGNNPLAGWGYNNNQAPPANDQPPSNPPSNQSPSSSPSPSPSPSSPPSSSDSGNNDGNNGNGGNGSNGSGSHNPVPAPPPADDPEPTPSPTPAPTAPPAVSASSKVITTTDRSGNTRIVTVWETVTNWVTKTVYEDGSDVPTTATPTAASNPSSPSGAAGWKAVGCFQDHNNARVLTGDKFPKLAKNTNEDCIQNCISKGFAVAGTEYGGQCFCGAALVGSAQLDATKCSMPCEGDASQICGGPNALSVWTASGNLPSKRHLQNHAHHHHRRNLVDYSPRRRR